MILNPSDSQTRYLNVVVDVSILKHMYVLTGRSASRERIEKRSVFLGQIEVRTTERWRDRGTRGRRERGTTAKKEILKRIDRRRSYWYVCRFLYSCTDIWIIIRTLITAIFISIYRILYQLELLFAPYSSNVIL